MATASPTRQPLGIGTLLSASMGMFFRRLPVFLMLTIIPTLVVGVLSLPVFWNALQLFASGDLNAAWALSLGRNWLVGQLWLVGLLFGLAAYLTSAAIILAAHDMKRAERVRPLSYLGTALRALPALVVLGVLLTLMGGGVLFLFGLVVEAVPLLGAIAALVLFLPTVFYISAGLSGLLPAALIEGAGFSSLSRSWSLTQGYRWSVAGLLFLFYFVLALISLAASLPLSLIGTSLASIEALSAALLLTTLVQIFVIVLQTNVTAILLGLTFLRLREVKEGQSASDLTTVFE